VGFERVSLKAGEVRHVRFALSARDLSTVSADGARAIRPDAYKIFVGGSQPNDAPPGEQTATFAISGLQELPK
jgi:beta-glucosidase